MKKIITVLIGVLFAVTLAAQTSNTFTYRVNATGGIAIGTGGELIQQAQVVNGKLYFIVAGDTIPFGIPEEDTEIGLAAADTNTYGGAITLTYLETQVSLLQAMIEAIGGAFVTSINVIGTGDATTIETNDGTLQMEANVEPDNATDTTITWSVIDGTGTATISTDGLMTAVTDGTVTARATANDASGVYGEEVITLSNQSEGFDGGMITNGDFADGETAWTDDAYFVIADGVATFNDGASGAITQAAADMATPMAYSTGYTISFDFAILTGTTINLSVRDAQDNIVVVSQALTSANDGPLSYSFTTGVAGDAQKGIRIAISSSSTATCSIDNVRLVAQ